MVYLLKRVIFDGTNLFHLIPGRGHRNPRHRKRTLLSTAI